MKILAAVPIYEYNAKLILIQEHKLLQVISYGVDVLTSRTDGHSLVLGQLLIHCVKSFMFLSLKPLPQNVNNHGSQQFTVSCSSKKFSTKTNKFKILFIIQYFSDRCVSNFTSKLKSNISKLQVTIEKVGSVTIHLHA